MSSCKFAMIRPTVCLSGREAKRKDIIAQLAAMKSKDVACSKKKCAGKSIVVDGIGVETIATDVTSQLLEVL